MRDRAYGNPFYGHEIAGDYVGGIEGRDFEDGAILVRFIDGTTSSDSESFVSSFGATIELSASDVNSDSLSAPIRVLLPEDMSVVFGILHAESGPSVVSATPVYITKQQESSPYSVYLAAFDGDASRERCESLLVEVDAVGTFRFQYSSGASVYSILTKTPDFPASLASLFGSDLLECRMDVMFGPAVICLERR